MSKEYKLEVEKREATKSGKLKTLRKSGKIPGIFYAHNSEYSINFIIDKSEIHNAIKSDANIFLISVGGRERNVLFKSVQYHPITEEIIHIDLYGVNMTKPVIVKVPITLSGDSIGVKEEGGVVNQAGLEVDIKCLPGDIPNFLEVDITELSIGDTFLANDMNLDDKLELISSPDMLIVSITLPMKEVEVVEEIDEELEEGEEGAEGVEGTEGTETDEKPASDGEPSDNKESDGGDQ